MLLEVLAMPPDGHHLAEVAVSLSDQELVNHTLAGTVQTSEHPRSNSFLVIPHLTASSASGSNLTSG